MPPTTSRTPSQSKISDTFRSSVKTTKPVKGTTPLDTKPKSIQSSTTSSFVPDTPDNSKHLVPNDRKLVSAAKAIEAERQAPFVHPESQSTIHTILRNFDLTPRYGPCVGISRLDRYRRAEKMGLKPPVEVLEILETEEGLRDWNTDLFSKKAAV